MPDHLSPVSRLAVLVAAALAVGGALAADAPAVGLQNAAQTSLGATARGSGAPFNKDWPADQAIRPERGGGRGTLFGSPMVGARVDIRLLVEADIRSVEVVQLDYHGTMLAKRCDIYVDDKRVTQAELPASPGKPVPIPLQARGRSVGVVVTETYPPRDLGNGKTGPNYGGWDRIRVLVATDVEALMKTVDAYTIGPPPAAIAPTGGSLAGAPVRVEGQPRRSVGHPCTIWDREDIAHYQAMLKTSPKLREQYEGLKRGLDERIAQPVQVPQPRRNEAGEPVHVSDRETGREHTGLALDIANLGAVYALSGEVKYAEYAKKLLLAYADAYPLYGVGARAGFNHDPSKVFDQRLGDAIWLIQVARGYDLIHGLPSITPEERRHIEEDLVRAAGKFIVANSSHLRGATNWSAIGTAAALAAGLAADDEALVNRALFGLNSDKNPTPWWEGQPNRSPSGVELHFSEKSIDADGMWAEGAMGYQFMALQALITDAEMLWHRGIDLYRYRDGALKRLFDSPLQFCYPDLTTPAIHDSGHGSIVGREAYLYEFAYRRYRDPAYLPILRQAGQHLAAQFQQWPVSVLYDVDFNAPADPVEPRSVNLFGVGYGILRLTDDRGTRSLLLDYGPNRSHGHPDKLNIDLWAFGDRRIPDPGSVWYEQPLYRRWYRTTLAHNTLVVDEREQLATGAEQLVFAPAETLAAQRARCDGAYSGVTMDRSLFLTADYVADLFGAFARLPRRFDLAWHPTGSFACDLPLQPVAFPEPVEAGYNELADTRQAVTDKPYAARYTQDGRTIVLHAAGGESTTVIAGEGHLGRARPTALLQRRDKAATLYGNVVDLSGEDRVRGARLSGGLDDGYALLSVATAQGDDLCFTAFRGGLHRAGALVTDAAQALVQRDASGVRALLLGGGTRLEADGCLLAREPAGLASVERAANGALVVGNPSPTNAVISLRLPGVAGLEAYHLDAQGRRTGPCRVEAGEGGALRVALPAGGRLELAKSGATAMHEHRLAVLRQREQELAAARERALAEAQARAQARAEASRAVPVPKGSLVAVQAEAFCGQGGGEVAVSSNKQAAVGASILRWDGAGHWLEWKVTVPAEGYYHLAAVYCTENATERELTINGEAQDTAATAALALPATGGFSNGSDDWQLWVAPEPTDGKPLLLKFKAGENTIRLLNPTGGSANFDYLAVFSPDVVPSRAVLSAPLAAPRAAPR